MDTNKKIHCVVCNAEIQGEKETLLDQFQVCPLCQDFLAINQLQDYPLNDDLGFV
ncbi:MAG: hypothetical protein ACK5HU_02230 [Flavobacteriales bacterium]